MIEHIDTAIRLALAAHAFALIIVNLTKTPKDDEVLHRAYRVIEMIAGIVSPRAKR